MFSLEAASSPKPGAQKNEDLFGFKGNTFWLLDGATSTDGPPLERDAHWLVQEADTVLHALATRELPLDSMAAHACRELKARYPGFGPHRPVAAAALWRIEDSRLQVAVAGDVSLVVDTGFEVLQLTDSRKPAPSPATETLFAALARGVEFESEEFRALRRDMKVLEASASNSLMTAAHRERTDFQTFEVPLGRHFCLLAATDGFMGLRRHHGEPRLRDFLVAVQSARLSSWIETLRDLERVPGSGKQFPRTKRHDDATAVLVRGACAWD